MSREKSEEAASGASRRKFLKRSGLVLLPYAAPVIASMAIHVEDAKASSKNRRYSPRMMMTRKMSSPSNKDPS